MSSQEMEFLHTEAKAIIDELDALRERVKRLNSVGTGVIRRELHTIFGLNCIAEKGARVVDESRFNLLQGLDSARGEAEVIRDVANDALDGSKAFLF